MVPPSSFPMPDSTPTPLYESQRLLSEYLLFHYGAAEEILDHPSLPADAVNFAQRTVTEMLPAGISHGGRALDLGCAVGRSSFELSLHFDEVIGIDYSHNFIQAANRLLAGESLPYQRHEEGRHYSTLQAVAPQNACSNKIKFAQGDAMQLPEDLGSFDLVHAANLICRLTDPELLLQRLQSLVKSGGLLILTTPCTWLEDFTPSAKWPSGSTLEWLKSHLDSAFELEETKDLPFLIREHSRKYQHTIAQGSRWRRK